MVRAFLLAVFSLGPVINEAFATEVLADPDGEGYCIFEREPTRYCLACGNKDGSTYLNCVTIPAA